jgi:CheY-like chemotaxis protein
MAMGRIKRRRMSNVAAALAPQESDERTHRPLRILLAEDDHDVRIGLARLLLFDGHDVYAVCNGAELLDELAAWILEEQPEPPVDVIVTDIRMPGLNGLNIVEGLRANGWDQPIIVISAFADDATRERIRQIGGVEFLAKPFDPGALERAVEQLSSR